MNRTFRLRAAGFQIIDHGLEYTPLPLPLERRGKGGELRIMHLRSEGGAPDFPFQLLHLCLKLKNLLFGDSLITLHIDIFRG